MEILSHIGLGLRGTAKQVIKGGLVLTNAVSGFTTEAGADFKDLVREARTEVNARHQAQINQPKIASEGLYDRLVKAGHSLWEAGLKMAAAANAGIVTMVAWCRGESKEKAEKQVDKAEESVEHFAKDLTQEEGINVIETMLLAAVA